MEYEAEMESSQNTTRPEWLNLAAVGVVAVLLSALGWVIADRFQPSSSPPQAAAPVDPTPTTVPASEEQLDTTTTAAAPEPSDSAPSSQLAVLEVAADEIDFGDASDSVELGIFNSGEETAEWWVETTGTGLAIFPSSGEMGPGESITVEVALDRSQIAEGEYLAELTFVWDDGRASLTAAAVHHDDPVIHNPQASPATVQVQAGESCTPTRTRVTARVRDTSELDRVLVRWDDGTGTVESVMSAAGNDLFEAWIGPFTEVGAVAAKVLAFDVLGNAGGVTIGLTVAPCQ